VLLQLVSPSIGDDLAEHLRRPVRERQT
jgi:hypothetical protein